MSTLFRFIGANAVLVVTLFIWVFCYRCERPKQARSRAELDADIREAIDLDTMERELLEDP